MMHRSSFRGISRTFVPPLLLLALTLAAPGAEKRPSSAARVASAECLVCHSDADPAARPDTNHAVGVDYERAGQRIALRPGTAPSGFGGTVAKDMLVEGRVECNSCHFTHDEETDTPYRLRLPDPEKTPFVPGARVVTTDLCLSCHDRARLP